MNTLDSETRKRFDELLPWYVTNQLAPVDRAWVEKLAAEHAEVRAALQWHRHLHEEIHAKYDQLPDDVGLQRLLQQVRKDKSPGKAQARPPEAGSGWGGRLRDWLGLLASRPAYAMALTVILVQVAVIGALLPVGGDQADVTHQQTRNIPSGPAPVLPRLEVTFKDSVTVRDMQLLLVSIEGRVVGGPGQLGVYEISVPEKRLEAAKQELEKSALVAAVAVADRPAPAVR